MQRPSAMVINPNGDPSIVEDLADIMCADTVDHVRMVLAVDRPNDTDPRSFCEAGQQNLGEGTLVSAYARHTQARRVVAGRG